MEPRAGAEDDRRNESGFWKDRARQAEIGCRVREIPVIRHHTEVRAHGPSLKLRPGAWSRISLNALS